MRNSLLILSLAGAVVAPRGTDAQAVIDPGMSKAQVIAKLGKPAVERTADASTYLFYRNGAERTVGMNDIVVLESDKVVDAVLRSSARKYSGTSSSPAAISAAAARRPKAMTTAPGQTSTLTVDKPKASADGKLLPAAKAQRDDPVRAMPPARSAIVDQQKKDAEAKADATKKADDKAPPTPAKKP